MLTALTQLAGLAPWYARIPSFLTAVLVTWALNRSYTFAGRGLQRRSVEVLSYVVIQVCGAVINLAIFGVCLFYWPSLRTFPVLPLAIGAIGGFAFNFGASNAFLYARRRSGVSAMNSAHQDQGYSGIENLEVMQEAVNYNRFLLNTVRSRAPAAGRILDFGAGSGQFAVPLSQLGFDVTALEPDHRLRSRIGSQGVRAVAGPDEVANASIDYIYTLNVLEHIPDDVAALRQLRAKLKPGGTLLIYVPAFPVLYTSMDAKVGHVRRYTRQTLTAAVVSAGFTIDDVGYVDSLGFFAALLFKAVGSKDGTVSLRALKLYDRLAFPVSVAVDALARRWFGKNLLLIARGPAPF